MEEPESAQCTTHPGDVATGVIPSRDVPEDCVPQYRAMRNAARQIAGLLKHFRNLKFDDLLDVVARETPKVFGGLWSALYLDDVGNDRDDSPRVVQQMCPCSTSALRRREDLGDVGGGEIHCGNCPGACEKLGAKGLSLVVPLELSTGDETRSDLKVHMKGYLCMCGMSPDSPAEREMISHKGTLIQEILNTTMSNAMSYQQVHRDTLTDSLTGVGTRRLFEEKLETEYKRTLRYKRPFCLAIVDVDNFKSINDEFGHATGDTILRDVAQRMNRRKRETDVLARYGGDEMVLLLPETELRNAVLVLDRMRGWVGEIELPHRFRVSISCGVVQQDMREPQPGNELFRRADQALYEAKRQGRNCVRTWEDVSGRLGYKDLVEIDTVNQFHEQISKLSAQSREMFVQSLWGLVHAVEARDPYTKSHSENVMRYAVGIAEVMSFKPDEIAVIRRAAMIHDIGMIGIPDTILLKPGKLSCQERGVMEQHPQIGVHILSRMRSLEREIPLVRHHHERWDGRGYPNGIMGKSIPLGARVLAIADSLEAITSNRVHRKFHTLPEALKIIGDAAGAQGDPDMVAALNRWVVKVGRELGKEGQVGTHDLLEHQKACVMTA